MISRVRESLEDRRGVWLVGSTAFSDSASKCDCAGVDPSISMVKSLTSDLNTSFSFIDSSGEGRSFWLLVEEDIMNVLLSNMDVLKE